MFFVFSRNERNELNELNELNLMSECASFK